VQPDNILLLDTYFMVVVHTGTHIAQWRKAEYHKKQEYENLRCLSPHPTPPHPRRGICMLGP
jgi:protein transport protein SEC23